MQSHSQLATQRSRPKRRRLLRVGATSIEFALVALPLVGLVLASIEFGRGMMVVQAMEEAARSGCRIATLRGQSVATAENEINQLMNLSGIANYTTVIQPSVLATTPQWSPVTVRVSANFADITWLPVPRFLASGSYTATCVLPREAEAE